ncbi:hypothetical protein Pcar_3166 [Syntrophotalea carbinolica DSM 2380]|uniref:Uncharacterized protein n=1 Tax=Syntrophotalea carbinolica (strain DSM 2380 / NBRC 103641 / GraBd1) TaxID=338963 RepID=Q0C701_SYNC1|nr:hypothetical protein Pcar_3166 [Syntrophotalea carbinolica DSM 2380]
MVLFWHAIAKCDFRYNIEEITRVASVHYIKMKLVVPLFPKRQILRVFVQTRCCHTVYYNVKKFLGDPEVFGGIRGCLRVKLAGSQKR